MAAIHPIIQRVTQRIQTKSQPARKRYLERIHAVQTAYPSRRQVSCTNLAHTFAALPANDKLALREVAKPNLAIVSAYNDMLSAHQPLENYPAIIKAAAREAGAVAQFAGGVPAMCDGVTQGQPGMELSLFSRDVIAQATAVALSHNVFDGALLLGVCDKIVPGLLIGALTFGHLPVIFVPAGPMTSGLPNSEKAKIRQLYAEGKVDREVLLESEARSYHGPGTCTFYGTANSNQMMMEIMGLHLPGTAFVNPGTPLREALTAASTQRLAQITKLGNDYRPIGELIDERAIVNAIIGLLATGGSTNHTIHLVAIARTAGMTIDWNDFDELSAIIPALAKVYPNGKADVNQFHAAGGIGFVIRELLQAGLLHADVKTVMGEGLARYAEEPVLNNGALQWRAGTAVSLDTEIVRPVAQPFAPDGGVKLLSGNLGRAIFKMSAVKPGHRAVTAPARIFDSQEAMLSAFQAGQLECDCIVVVRFQGPRANGMPELHKLTPSLGVLQDRGFKVALVTDGRMSGASGKVPAAIHVTPECVNGGALAKLREGDLVRLDGEAGILECLVDEKEWRQRTLATADLEHNAWGVGRELFATFRQVATGAEQGALTWNGVDNQ